MNPTATGAVRDYTVELCERREIVDFVETWHYSQNVNGLTTDYCFKLLDTTGQVIGAMIYGKIAMANVWKKYADVELDLIELKRLCCIDNTPKNTESFFIGKTLQWLKKNTQIKTVISYADMTYAHSGTIYKASNFIHKGFRRRTSRICRHAWEAYLPVPVTHRERACKEGLSRGMMCLSERFCSEISQTVEKFNRDRRPLFKVS